MAKTNTVITGGINMKQKTNAHQVHVAFKTCQLRDCLKYFWHVSHRNKLTRTVENILKVVKADDLICYKKDVNFA